MHSRRLALMTGGITVLVCVLGVLGWSRLSAPAPQQLASPPLQQPASSAAPRQATATSTAVLFEPLYVGLTRDAMIAEAEAIVLGDIQAIGPARWNQDSGRDWRMDGATSLPFHEVQVLVRDALVDTVGLSNPVTLIVLGASPAGTLPSAGATLTNPPAHTLTVGEQMLLFLVKRPLAWNGGPRAHGGTCTVLRLVGAPKLSYLTRGADGRFHEAASLAPDGAGKNDPISLDEFRRLVRQRRAD